MKWTTAFTRALVLVAGASAVLAIGWAVQAADDWPKPPPVETESYPYDGEFTLARIRFDPTQWGGGPFTWNLDLKWNHDYPQAEQNFTRILEEVTSLETNPEGGNVLEITDPRLFEHPWAYICEVGYWDPTDEEIEILRSYLLKGGFLMVDDFIDMGGSFQWRNFTHHFQRLLPGYQLRRMDLSDGIFSIFFPMESLDLNDPDLPPLDGAIFGVYEDDDPEERLMMIVNYNMDVGDYWEWSDQGLYPIDLTQRGFKLGVNYVMYGLTH